MSVEGSSTGQDGEAGTATLPLVLFAAGLTFMIVWTLGVELVTLSARPFSWLYVVLALATLAAGLSFRAVPFIAPVFVNARSRLPAVFLRTEALRNLKGRQIVELAGLGMALAVSAALAIKTNRFSLLWLSCLIGGGYALAQARRSSPLELLEFRPAVLPWPRMSLTVGTLMVIGLCWLIYFGTSLPDDDDCLFLNFAIGAKHQRAAVYLTDSMLGIPGLDFIKSTYRLESYQLLAGVLSDLSGASTVFVAHAVVPAFACVFAATSLVLLHSALFGRAWLGTLLIHLGWSLALDGALSSFGRHGIPRFFQGKGPFVLVMVPLIAYLTSQTVRRESNAALVLLAGSMVAALGFTANAIYVAPFAAALVVIPLFVLGDRQRRRVCLRVVLPMLYPLALAAYLMVFDPPSPSEFARDPPITGAFWAMFGSAPGVILALALLVVGALAALFNRRLAYVTVYTLGVLCCVLNPFLWSAFGGHVTGHLNVRLLWTVPVPLILTLIAGVAFVDAPRYRRLLILGVVALAVVAPDSIVHKVTWGFSTRKVPEPSYSLATAVNAQTPPGGLILAPEEISAWIPSLEDARPVVEGRGLYIPQRARFMPPDQFRNRKTLFSWVMNAASGRPSPAEVSELLTHLDVKTVVTEAGSPAFGDMKVLAVDGAYGPPQSLGEYRVFFRK